MTDRDALFERMVEAAAIAFEGADLWDRYESLTKLEARNNVRPCVRAALGALAEWLENDFETEWDANAPWFLDRYEEKWAKQLARFLRGKETRFSARVACGQSTEMQLRFLGVPLIPGSVFTVELITDALADIGMKEETIEQAADGLVERGMLTRIAPRVYQVASYPRLCALLVKEVATRHRRPA